MDTKKVHLHKYRRDKESVRIAHTHTHGRWNNLNTNQMSMEHIHLIAFFLNKKESNKLNKWNGKEKKDIYIYVISQLDFDGA